MASPGLEGPGRSRLYLRKPAPHPTPCHASLLFAGPTAPHLCAWDGPRVVGNAASGRQHHLWGQDLLLCQKAMSSGRIVDLVQKHKVTPSYPLPGPLIQQWLADSSFIVYQ